MFSIYVDISNNEKSAVLDGIWAFGVRIDDWRYCIIRETPWRESKQLKYSFGG